MNTIITRILIGGTGLGVGIITFLPNIMLSDNSSKKGLLAAKLGISASGLFGFAGILGLIHNKYIPIKSSYICGGVALTLQISALIMCV